ncbi:MAG: hypothetical protein HON90_12550 [Halobacteriovoraceae bacterium]|jgi:hypothetical protein|nr:hypothetical protein [Halobacteriovoraceae bacterium]
MKMFIPMILLASSSVFASNVEVYDCSFIEPELQGMTHRVEIKNTVITTSVFADGEVFVDQAPCDLLPTGNKKMSLICTDEEGDTMNIILDTKALTLEGKTPWGFETTMVCTKK